MTTIFELFILLNEAIIKGLLGLYGFISDHESKAEQRIANRRQRKWDKEAAYRNAHSAAYIKKYWHKK